MLAELYVTSLCSIPHPQPLSREARGASSKTALLRGFVIVNKSEPYMTAFDTMRASRPRPGPMRQAGLSLVELMIGLTIGLLLTVGLVTMIAGTSRTFQIQDDFSRMQENGSLALNYVGDDIRMAGFYGLATTTDNIDATGLPALATDCGSAANPPAANWAYATDRPLTGADLTVANVNAAFPCINASNFQAGQVLVVRRASGFALPDPNTDGNLTDAVTGQPNYNKTIYIQSEPARGLLFQGENFATLRADSRTAQMGIVATVDAPIFEYYMRVYYIRPCSRPSAGTTCSAAADDNRPIPTLARQELGFTALGANTMVETPLVEGVERIAFLYGIDADPAVGPAGRFGDGVPERYIRNPTAADWANVVAVRVVLIMRSPNPTAGYDDAGKTYDMGDGTTFTCTDFAAPACSYKRKVFTQTFLMRNISLRRGT